MELIAEQGLHNLAMEIVGKRMEKEGFQFMTVNSELQKDPQFVCLKDKKLHFVIVRAISYPNNPLDFDKVFMNTVRTHANKFEAKTYYAGVGLAHAYDYEVPLKTNDPYAINFQGLQKIESDD